MSMTMAAIAMSLAISACGTKSVDPDEPTPVDPEPSGEVTYGSPSHQAGWRIYQAGTYRYGPSFITNEDGSIDAWFSAVGNYHGLDKMLFNSGEAQVASVHKLIDGDAAQYFKIDREFSAVQVRCPSWSSTEESMTLKFYKWKGDYASTVASEPFYTTREINYTDNSWFTLFAEGGSKEKTDIKLPAGEYLWLATEGTSLASVWGSPSSSSTGGLSPKSFKNGKAVSNYQFESRVLTEYTEGSVFWDQITYQHSDDGGKTWTKEIDCLQPNEFGEDHYSNCDPGVAKWGGWYYIGYTSTLDTRGTDNNVYVARSKNPQGPWDKWNGNGWGGNPAPVILYHGIGNPDNYGAGEPCMVVVDDVVYFYYSWNDADPKTKVSIASASDENWPAHLTDKGVAIDKSNSDYQSADHSDVKYRPDLKKFYAINTAKRMTSNSFIQIWTSDDGLKFKLLSKMSGTGFKPGLHNCGWTGDALGHQDPTKPQYVSYAYGLDSWGQWDTWFAPLKFQEIKK